MKWKLNFAHIFNSSAMLYPIQNDIRNVFDLSGIWDFRADPDEVGEREGWHT